MRETCDINLQVIHCSLVTCLLKDDIWIIICLNLHCTEEKGKQKKSQYQMYGNTKKSKIVGKDTATQRNNLQSTIAIFNTLFPMHPFSSPKNIRKPYGFLIFSGGRESVHWKQMGLSILRM